MNHFVTYQTVRILYVNIKINHLAYKNNRINNIAKHEIKSNGTKKKEKKEQKATIITGIRDEKQRKKTKKKTAQLTFSVIEHKIFYKKQIKQNQKD